MHGHKGSEYGKVHLLRPRKRLRDPAIAKGLKKQRAEQDQTPVKNTESLPSKPILHLATKVIEHDHLQEKPDRGSSHKRIGYEPPDLAVCDRGAAVSEQIYQYTVTRGNQERGRDHGGAMKGYQQGDQAHGEFPKVKEGFVFPGKNRYGHAIN